MISPGFPVAEIDKLKKKLGAVILAHNYQIDEVQDIADFVGDSLELARYSAQTDAKVLVLCGVYFMAETAAILNPDKIVLIPDELSGCPLSDMLTADQLRRFKSNHPGLPVVCYVNSSAEVKAESDICCTSSNALQVVNSIASDSVLFVPDRNLGDYVQQQTSKKLIIFDGYCLTHERVTAEDITLARAAHPGAFVISHPECRREVRELSDKVASTSGMLKYVKNCKEKTFIVATEMGLLFRMKKENPGKTFFLATPKLICPNMKKNNLSKILSALQTLAPQVKVSAEIASAARHSIERMLALKKTRKYD